MAGGVDWGCSLGCSEHSTHVWRQSAHHRRPCIKRGRWPRPEPESCTSRRTAGSARAASMTCTGAVHCMQATIGPTAATARNGAQREKEKEREKVRECVCVFVRAAHARARQASRSRPACRGARAAAPVGPFPVAASHLAGTSHSHSHSRWYAAGQHAEPAPPPNSIS